MVNVVYFHRWLILFSIFCISSIILAILFLNNGNIFGTTMAILLFLVSFYLTYKIIRFYTSKKERNKMTRQLMTFTQIFDNVESQRNASIFNKEDLEAALKSPHMFSVN